MKHIIFIFLLLSMIAGVKAQHSIVHPYSIIDNFYNNANNWPMLSDKYENIAIKGQRLIMEGLEKNDDGPRNYRASKQFPVDVKKNFSCSVKCIWKGGTDSRIFGISYCGSKPDYGYVFCINAQGFYAILAADSNSNDGWMPLRPAKESSYIFENSVPNTLKIEKVGDNIKFLINGNTVDTFPFDGGYGNWFGCFQGGLQRIEFTEFKLEGTRL